MPLEKYGNTYGSSSIVAFEAGEDFIRIEFNSGRVYLYSETSAGADNLRKMKELAEEGEGLAGFINANKPGFSIREK